MSTANPNGDGILDRILSRRTFVQGALVTIAGAAALSIPRSTVASTPPAQDPTTLTSILEATPNDYDAGGNPTWLLTSATSKGTTPEKLARAIDGDAGDAIALYVGVLDLGWPYAILFGNQPLADRTEALRYAIGNRVDRPDLGPYRTDPPAFQRPAVDLGADARDASWRYVAQTILGLATNLSIAQSSPDEPQYISNTRPAAPELVTQEP